MRALLTVFAMFLAHAAMGAVGVQPSGGGGGGGGSATNVMTNTIWVDVDEGDDSTAIIGRRDLPYKTFGAAASNAVSDTTIIIAPTIEYVRASFHTGGYSGTLEAPVNFDKLTNVTVLAYGYTMDSTNTIGEFINIRECDNLKIYGLTLLGTNALRGGVGPEPDQSAHTGDNWSAINFLGTNANITLADGRLLYQTRQGISHLFGARTTTNVLIQNFYGHNIGSTNVGGSFDGAFISGIGSDWTIKDCVVEDALRAVEWQHSTSGDVYSGGAVVDCRFYNIWREGLIFLSSPYRDISIENTLVEMQAGALVGGLSRNVSFSAGTRDVTFRRCVFRGSDGVNEYAVVASGGNTNISFIECIWEDSTGGAASFSSGASRNIRFLGSTFQNMASRALQLVGNNIQVQGNYFWNVGTNNSREPIRLPAGGTNILIHGNIFDHESGVSHGGYAVSVASANIDSVSIRDNFVSPNFASGPVSWGATTPSVDLEHLSPGVTNISGEATPTISWLGPRHARLVLSGATTVSFADTPAEDHMHPQMLVTVENSGSDSVSWPGAVQWSGNVEPVLDSSSTNLYVFQWNGEDIIGGMFDGGSGVADGDGNPSTNHVFFGSMKLPYGYAPVSDTIYDTNRFWTTNLTANDIVITVNMSGQTNQPTTVLVNPGSGYTNLTFSGSILWEDGTVTQPILASNAVSYVTFMVNDEGETNGFVSGPATDFVAASGITLHENPWSPSITISNSSGTAPGGASQSVQINDGGSFGSASNLVWKPEVGAIWMTNAMGGTPYITVASNTAVAFRIEPHRMGTIDADDVEFMVNSTTVWKILSNGKFVPGGDGAYDIGETATRVRTIYTDDLFITNPLGTTEGGTGSNLTDPGADRLWGWDDTDNDVRWFIIGSGLTYDAATDTISADPSGGGGGDGDTQFPIYTNDVLVANATNLNFYGINGIDVSGSNTTTYADIRIGMAAQTHTLYIDAGALVPETTDGATSTTVEEGNYRTTVDFMEFNDTASNGVQFVWIPPKNYDLGDVKFKLYHTTTNDSSAQTNVFELSAKSVGHNESFTNVAWGTAVTITNHITSSNTFLLSASIPVTPGNTPAEEDLMHVRVRRLSAHAHDVLGGNARLKGVWMQWTDDGTVEEAW